MLKLRKYSGVGNDEFLREATEEEHAASEAASETDGIGLITVEINGEPTLCWTEQSGKAEW